jgi:hypothetical protein
LTAAFIIVGFLFLLLPFYYSITMATDEKQDVVQSSSDESPDLTVADDDKLYMFPPAEVGIPLTKFQWAFTFVG